MYFKNHPGRFILGVYMEILIITAAVIFSFASIYVYYNKKEMYVYIKPIPIILLVMLYLFYFSGSTQKNIFHILIIVGLIFGLIGDILLAFKMRFFLLGLIAFLIGHVSYIISFTGKPFIIPNLLIAGITSVLSFYIIILFSKINRETRKKMIVPIVLYIIALTTMFLTAMNYDMNDKFHAPLFAIGSALFVISDGTLAWERFVKENKFSTLIILSTYYAAQILIAVKGITILNQGFIN
jgi:uncharacterized membrane protein YhhN